MLYKNEHENVDIDRVFNSPAEEYDVFIRIAREEDIAVARQMAKQLAQEAGFSLADITKIATAVSELARNIYRYAGQGRIMIKKLLNEREGPYLEVIASDRGPGIAEIELVMTKGYTTYERSLGIGLSGVKRLMDSFAIYSEVGKGTVVIAGKRRRKF
ncbi:Serine/threonine-protein kinase RsbT [Neomoorella glycerini]|uniref:Serine/threonine-protein kinase RsbT n=1 Tax=Neomoorella glycerini TaxID=55779 RepID=A0A6I5ZMM0_9FIRM|nr:anti-sigma regulatory factor [Moorella glycerini]QGP90871.1 Serine/threonine-protein kinase RsbT [Moorella glycerini]